MAKTMKKLDSKLQKQQQGWPKISNTARKYNKDENLENYNSEVQCTREHILGHDWLTKAAFTRQIKVGKLVLVNSGWCV